MTNSCFYPDAVIDIHALSMQAPASSTDWRPLSSFRRRKRYLKDSGAGHEVQGYQKKVVPATIALLWIL